MLERSWLRIPGWLCDCRRIRPLMRDLPPPAVRVTAAFFAASGLLELVGAAWETQPAVFWPLWDAFFRGAAHALLAYGLWGRIALCRTIAIVYCLAALVTYGAVLALAFAHAPVQFPDSVRLQSLFQVPSCALLLPFLRSPRAAGLFPRSLFRR
jgi:hypothetical protein